MRIRRRRRRRYARDFKGKEGFADAFFSLQVGIVRYEQISVPYVMDTACMHESRVEGDRLECSGEKKREERRGGKHVLARDKTCRPF